MDARSTLTRGIYPWAGRALDESGGEMNRADTLHERAIEYQANVSGPGGANMRNALIGLKALAEDSVSFQTTPFSRPCAARPRVSFRRRSCLDPDALDALIARAGMRFASTGFQFAGGRWWWR